MHQIQLEVSCPRHGFERFSIKIVRRYNIPSKDIFPHLRKLKREEISELYVGRNVTDREIRDFLTDYLYKIGMKEMILTMKMV